MTADFEFQRVQTSLSTITIEDIGNTTILARDSRGMEYYLSIKTDLGWTEMLEYGASAPDIEQLPNNVVVKYQRFPYSEQRITKSIQTFLDNRYADIVEATEIDRQELLELTRDLVEVFVNG